jgi:hypothetical protein
MTDRPLIRLAPGGDRRVKAGHPWAFSNEIAMSPALRALPPGSVVRLEGDDGVRHGAWHFNPHSLIAARRLDADPEDGDRRRAGGFVFAEPMAPAPLLSVPVAMPRTPETHS